jgi:radical SAM-linked protein
MRFASHRDVARAIERGVRKAGIPVAYSAGFSPHPRISYSGGAPTGSASEAEYLELSVTRRCEPGDIGRRLDAALPDGIDVVEVVEADGTSAGLQLEASEWEVIWPGVAPDAAARSVRAFLAAPSVEVERLTSKGTRILDARAAVVSLTSAAGHAGAQVTRRAGTDLAGECAILRMIVRQLTPAVRPDDVLAALRQLSALEPGSPPLATRLWQGPISALTAAQTGAQTPMSVICEAAGPDRPGQPLAAASPPERDSAAISVAGPGPVIHRPEPNLPEPRPACQGPAAGAGELRSGSTTDNAVRLEAESAEMAPATQVRANEQLPRGTFGQLAGPRARKPDGRDCTDARDRATGQTARTQ